MKEQTHIVHARAGHLANAASHDKCAFAQAHARARVLYSAHSAVYWHDHGPLYCLAFCDGYVPCALCGIAAAALEISLEIEATKSPPAPTPNSCSPTEPNHRRAHKCSIAPPPPKTAQLCSRNSNAPVCCSSKPTARLETSLSFALYISIFARKLLACRGQNIYIRNVYRNRITRARSQHTHVLYRQHHT